MNTNCGATSPPTFDGLSWEEARSRLRRVVQQHLDKPQPHWGLAAAHRQKTEKGSREDDCRGCAGDETDATTTQQEQTSALKNTRLRLLPTYLCRLCFCCEDVDMYASLVASILLLTLTATSFRNKVDEKDLSHEPLKPTAAKGVYVGELVGGVLAVFTSVTSILLVTSRRLVADWNVDVGLRRSLKSFLLSLDRLSAPNQGGKSLRHVRMPSFGGRNPPDQQGGADNQEQNALENCMRLSGSSLTDVYPVYRCQTKSGKAEWHHIPSLLLVEGDMIALQVGDTSPALVEMCPNNSITTAATSSAVPNPITISGGERVTFEMVDGGGIASYGCGSLPRGRTTIPPESRELLFLCNDMRIFVLKETPLDRFLRRRHSKNKPPQLHRQAKSIRRSLLYASVPFFVVTTTLIFVRPNILSTDLTVLLPIPLIAVLSVLPMCTPIVTMLLEVFGIARILVAAHPYVSQSCNGDTVKKSEAETGRLLFRYCSAALRTRLLPEGYRIGRFFSSGCGSSSLIPIPHANMYLLEKLGVATALALIDDELACEPQSTPQQLLIPSGHGLKLLDLCPAFDEGSEVDSENEYKANRRKRTQSSLQSSVASFDSDSDNEQQQDQSTTNTINTIGGVTLDKLRRKWRKASGKKLLISMRQCDPSEMKDYSEVQFEDPAWWQFLPSLKCIGLACLLVDGHSNKESSLAEIGNDASTSGFFAAPDFHAIEKALVRHICHHQKRKQLLSLARCIGFSTAKNANGDQGDITPFTEVTKLHILATRLLRNRLSIDRHALGLEESRRWGYLHRDVVCVIVQDKRSKAFQLLTVGNPNVVAELCSDSWHGENSTISPLSSTERKSVLDTSSNWSLSDLDVVAFSYAPVPYTLEQKIGKSTGTNGAALEQKSSQSYLIDNRGSKDSGISMSKETTSPDWSLVNHQIFLGMLGSLVSPRKEIDLLLETCSSAGVRFVYFSPRNMRRTKELAAQMGIDVAWNCAISLRSLDEGQEDPHRMVSAYADWDVNARLPHGIEDVRRHLREVDNVPLLVSLFTDVNEQTTTDMINIFRQYHDTVIAVGLSHLSFNDGPFCAADIAIGVDVLEEEMKELEEENTNDVSGQNRDTDVQNDSGRRQKTRFSMATGAVLMEEVRFVSSIAAHGCVFSLKGASAISHLPELIGKGRAALEATSSAALFVLNGGLSLAFLALLCPCSVATAIPVLPSLGSVLYLIWVLPILGLSMSMTDADSESMERVPSKNDVSVVFTARDEGRRLYSNAILRAFLPALFGQLVYLIAFGELVSVLEPSLMQSSCSMPSSGYEGANWVHAIRCDALRNYTGLARTSAGSLLLSEMALCVLLSSAGFVFRTQSLAEEQPWKKNHAWMWCLMLDLVLVIVFLVVTLEKGTFRLLPWYYYFLSVLFPFFCLGAGEVVKISDRRFEKRAVTLRRLQFETRLGMWSPK